MKQVARGSPGRLWPVSGVEPVVSLPGRQTNVQRRAGVHEDDTDPTCDPAPPASTGARP